MNRLTDNEYYLIDRSAEAVTLSSGQETDWSRTIEIIDQWNDEIIPFLVIRYIFLKRS